jgi:hypothetical protein
VGYVCSVSKPTHTSHYHSHSSWSIPEFNLRLHFLLANKITLPHSFSTSISLHPSPAFFHSGSASSILSNISSIISPSPVIMSNQSFDHLFSHTKSEMEKGKWEQTTVFPSLNLRMSSHPIMITTKRPSVSFHFS